MTDLNVVEDNWVEQGQEISSPEELREYVAYIRAAVSHMNAGLARAAFGALSGRSWLDTPGEERMDRDTVLRNLLEMTVTPAGMSAKEATFRQSLATLLVVLDTADRATLTAWLAQIAAMDPDRTA